MNAVLLFFGVVVVKHCKREAHLHFNIAVELMIESIEQQKHVEYVLTAAVRFSNIE